MFLKGYLSPSVGWESNIGQGVCSGKVGGTAPFSSQNHVARFPQLIFYEFTETACIVFRCGFVNVFEWGKGSCIIDFIE